ncbi:hypothetical protein Tsubulata_043952, partial [Turnera subulata]
LFSRLLWFHRYIPSYHTTLPSATQAWTKFVCSSRQRTPRGVAVLE